jgi:hypothetical protein
MFSDTRERAARLLAGMNFSNPFVRVLLGIFTLGIVLTAVLVKIARMCWTAARDMPGQELTIYAAGCLAASVCCAVLLEGTRPWVTGEPSSFSRFLALSLASLPIGIVALPIVFIFFVTSPR